MKTLLLLSSFFIFLYNWYKLRKSYYVHIPEKHKVPTDYGLSFETVSIKTKDGLTLAGWYIPVKNPKAVVILVHGYLVEAGGRPLMLHHAKYLHAAGYSVFLPALRAHGPSEGKKVTFGTREWMDVEAAYDYMKSLLENKGKKIGFFGNSMGAATVLVTAGKTKKGDFVIASVPYANLKRLYEHHLRIEKKPVKFILPFVVAAVRIELGKDSAKNTPDQLIQNINVPLFLVSASHDKKVSGNDAKYLFEKATTPKELWEVESGHEVYDEHPKAFQEKVLNFLNKNI